MQILESTWRNVQNTDFTKICIRIHFRSSIFRIWCKPLVLFWNLPVTHVSIKIVQNLLTDFRFQIPAQADSSLDGNLRFGRVLLQADSRFRVPKRGQIAKKKWNLHYCLRSLEPGSEGAAGAATATSRRLPDRSADFFSSSSTKSSLTSLYMRFDSFLRLSSSVRYPAQNILTISSGPNA